MSETTTSSAPKWVREKLEKKYYPQPSGQTWSFWAIAVVVGQVVALGIACWHLNRADLSMGFKIWIGVKEVVAFSFALVYLLLKS